MTGPATVYDYVALGGGGYADSLAMAYDGSKIFVRSNLANSYRWRLSTDAWDNVSTSPNMDALGIGVGMYGTPYAHAIAPTDSNRVYLIAGTLPTRLSYQAFGDIHGQFYRSNDGGDTWFKPGSASPSTDPLTNPFSISGGNIYNGPVMTVDPLNADIVWTMGYNGAVHVTYNGGTSWNLVSGLMSAALIYATVAANNTGFFGIAGGGALNIPSSSTLNPLLATSTSVGTSTAVFDVTHPFAIGGSAADAVRITSFAILTGVEVRQSFRRRFIYQSLAEVPPLTGAGPPTPSSSIVTEDVAVNFRDTRTYPSAYTVDVPYYTANLLGSCIQGNSGGTSFFGQPGVVDGDQLYFAIGGGIAIDKSLGSVANPGGTGVMSKLVYFGWIQGATSIWKTEDAGGDLTAGHFSPVGSGGPSFCGGKMKVSSDADLGGGGNNVLWVIDLAGAWRWVRTHPTPGTCPTVLADNTWTQFPATAVFPSGEQSVQTVLPDPVTQGRVLLFRHVGNHNPSLDYGNTLIGYIDVTPIKLGDTPWLSSDQVDMGDVEFDRLAVNKVWIANGCGTWFFNPTNTSALQTWYSKMQPDMQSLIISQLVKCPAPSRKLVMTLSQDRPIVVSDDETVVPDGYFPGGVSQIAGCACYSLNDPTKIWAGIASNIFRYDGGPAVGGIQNWTAITTPGANGWPFGTGNITVQSRSSTEILALGRFINILYGTLSAGVWSWVNSTYLGSPVFCQGTNVFGKAKISDIDRVSGTIYYVDLAALLLYKSTDGGATLTLPKPTFSLELLGDVGATLVCAHGHDNHLFFAKGVKGDGAIYLPPPDQRLLFTNDGGVTWNPITATNYVWSVATGPAAPSGTYPAIYIVGQMLGDPVGHYSVHRCTDFNSTTFAGTWEDIGVNLKGVDCSGLTGGIYTDPDVYGKIYLATDDNGVVVGQLEGEPPPPSEAGTGSVSMTNTYGKTTFKRVKIPHA